MFMEKPSKKMYPDYYQVIDKPIDLLTIEANIKNEKYSTEDDALEDFKVSSWLLSDRCSLCSMFDVLILWYSSPAYVHQL